MDPDALEDKALAVARWLDQLPLSPAVLGDRAATRFGARRRRRAAVDPEWAAIEARRNKNGGNIFLSDDLTLADWETQRRIADRITPDTRGLALARWAERHTAVRALRGPIARRQRARRGWTDGDVGELGSHLATHVAALLEALATNCHTSPGTDEFPTPASWQAALTAQAASLRAWLDGDADQLHAWHALATTPGGDDAAEVARHQMEADDAARYQAAQAAMHWVADHLGTLWD